MPTAYLVTLIDYHYWATHRLLAAVDALPAEQFTQSLESSFPSIQATLGHLLNTEAVWLARLTGAPAPALAPELLPDPAAVRRRWAQLEPQLRAFVAGLQPGDEQKTIRFRSSKGPQEDGIGEAITHLVNHGTYHRGQLTTLLRQVGAEPAGTDLIAYYRSRRAGI